MRKSILCVALALATLPAWGQEATTFYFAAPFSINSGHETGVPLGNGQVSDSVIQLSAPAFSLMAPTQRSEVTLSYQPEFQLFATHRDLNSWNHSAITHFLYRATPRWTLDGGDLFTSTKDYSVRQQSMFLLPRGRYNENALYAQGAYELTPNTALNVRFDNSYTSFDNRNLSPLFDHFTNGLTASMGHRFNPKHKLTVNYSYVKTYRLHDRDALGNFLGRPATPAKYGGAAYDYAVSPTLLLEASGGVVRTDVTSYTVSGIAEKRIRKLVLSAGYSRYLSFFGGLNAPTIQPAGQLRFASGLQGSTVSETAGVHVRGELTQRVKVQFNLSGSRNVGLRTKNLQSFINQFKVEYKLTDRLVAFTSAELYGQNANTMLNFPINRRRYFGGLEVVLFPTAEMVVRKRDAEMNPPAPVSSDDDTTKPGKDADRTKPAGK